MVPLAAEARPAPPHTFLATPTPLHSDMLMARKIVPRPQCNGNSCSKAFPLEKLTSELLLLLLDHLRDVNYTSLLTLRLVSKQFDQLSSRVAFFNLHPNKALLEQLQCDGTSALAEHICNYTRHLHLRSNLDKLLVANLMRFTRDVRTIHFYYMTGERSWLPAQVLSNTALQENGTRLHIHDLPVRRPQNEALPQKYFESIPLDSVSSLRLAAPAPPLTFDLDPLRRLLSRAPRLESFHYRERGQGTRFWFRHGERLPALKDLLLQSYQWTHSTEDVRRHWQLSSLTSIQLIDVSIFKFLSSVQLDDLATVRHLLFEDNISHVDDDHRERATELTCKLIRSHIKALQSLELICSIPLLQLDAIVKHSGSLEHLKLRDHAGFEEDGNVCPTIHPDGVALLSRNLHSITTLELDMDTALCDPIEFLHAVSIFKRLKNLTLHVQTVLTSYEDMCTNQDRDYDAAISTLKLISQSREQLGYPLLRKLTINVGGWRPVMIRRISTAWREKNENGIFAERCFTFEREALSKEFTVTEHSCSEPPPSCKNTPDLPEAIGMWNRF